MLADELSYRVIYSDGWKLRVLPEKWSSGLSQHIMNVVRTQFPSLHPQTVSLRFPDRNDGARLFLKVYHAPSGMTKFKDVLRESKAFRFLRQGLELSRAGFFVPQVIAAGEERRYYLLRRAFVLTTEVQGEVVPQFLQRHVTEDSRRSVVAEKRHALALLGRQIRRLHELGFVHGDLVPSNIIVSEANGAGLRFYLMDNDRTRRYPAWLPQTMWKRNLVQLNRFPLPGISLQDRIRFFRAYSGRRDWSRQDQTLLRWLEIKTRKRRKECDAADVTGSFRRLMQWDGEFADRL
jgi:serine/threonine protein kinase